MTYRVNGPVSLLSEESQDVIELVRHCMARCKVISSYEGECAASLWLEAREFGVVDILNKRHGGKD